MVSCARSIPRGRNAPGALRLGDLKAGALYVAPSGRLCTMERPPKHGPGSGGSAYYFRYLDQAGSTTPEGFWCSFHNVWMLRRVAEAT